MASTDQPPNPPLLSPLTLARHSRPRAVRLETLILLRWLSILGQTAAVAVTAFLLGFKTPVATCLTLIALSAWSSVFLRIRFGAERRLTEPWISAVMVFDIVQLSGLLYFTGGLTNPFAVMMVAPVLVSAIALPATRTVLLALIVLVALGILAVAHEPLPWYEGRTLDLPFLYVAGIWTALACSLAFIGTYAYRVAQEARQLADALAATEIVLTREQHLQALDGLAAAAAHALGTPLATISVVSRELEKEVDPATPLGEDIALLRSQSERCREILSRLNTMGDDAAAPLVSMSIAQLLEEVVAPLRLFESEIRIALADGGGGQPVVARSPGLTYGLGNIVENAVDFAEHLVCVSASWTEHTVAVTIEDDGPGFSEAVLDRIGEPYIGTRTSEGDQKAGGMGLGLFIAKTLLERSGGIVGFTNRRPLGRGALVRVEWPRSVIDITRREAGPFRTADA